MLSTARAAEIKQVCYSKKNTNLWSPEKATTFVFSVYEIELIIQSLTAKIEDPDNNLPTDDRVKLNKQIENWKTVLTNYQKSNSDATAMFTSETMVLNDMVNRVNDWDNTINSDQDYSSTFEMVNDRLKEMYNGIAFNNKIKNNNRIDNDVLNGAAEVALNLAQGLAFPAFTIQRLILQGYYAIEKNCGDDLKSAYHEVNANKYMKSACKNFDLGRWKKFTDII